VQEDIEQRTMSVTVQAAKLSGRVLKAAIAAALNPDQEYLDEGYYFFVTGNPNGDHPGEYFYAKTADEHHQNCIIAGWG